MSIVAKRLDGSRCHLVWPGQSVGLALGPDHIVLDGDPTPKRGTAPAQFSPHVCVDKQLDGSRCHLVYGDRTQPRRHCTQLVPLFIAILPAFQTLSSNGHFALLSSPDFHTVIILYGSHALRHCKLGTYYPCPRTRVVCTSLHRAECLCYNQLQLLVAQANCL